MRQIPNITGFTDDEIIIYTDGSFNNKNGTGYGFLICDSKNNIIVESYGHLSDEKFISHRNVYGEIIGCMRAINFCIKHTDCKKFKIFADYKGVECWANETWKRNKELTINYNNYIKNVRNSGYDINILHVDGHSGVDGNERADELAKLGRDDCFYNESRIILYMDETKVEFKL